MTRSADGPFSAPASTTLRFGTLILLSASATAMWYWLFSTIWRPIDGVAAQARCEVRSGYYLAMGKWLPPDEQARYNQYHRCMANVTPNSVLWVAVSLALLAVVTLALFALQPVWRRRRKRLIPIEALSAADTTALREELRALVRTAGLARPPRFLIESANPRPAGRAFGGLGRREVSLSAGLVVQLRHSPEKFRAVVLHELAHDRNGDVTITYVTLAAWRAFVLVTVIPALASLVDPALATAQPFRNPFQVGWSLWSTQLATLGWFFPVLTALVYVSRIAVLRVREGYADARAAQWLAPAVLREVFTAAAAQDGTRWWHTHPRLAARVRLLGEPVRLLRPGFWENFTAGFAVQIAGIYAYLALDSSWDGSSGSLINQGAHDAATLVTAMVVGIAGWRGASFIGSGQGGRGVYTRAGLGLGLGLASSYGLVMLREGLLLHNSPALSVNSFTLAGLGRDLVLVALMLVCTVLLCHWAGYCSQLVGATSRWPGGLLAAVAVLAGAWACLRWWNNLNYGMPPIADTLAGDASMWRQSVLEAHWTVLDPAVVKGVLYPFVLLPVLGPVTSFAAPLLWLVPLLLGAARRGTVRSAARSGVVAALVWLVIEVSLRAVAHATVPSGTRAGGGFAVVFVCWEIAAVLVVQLGTGLVLGARRMRLMPSLFATTVTGVLCCLALWAAHVTDSCVPGLQISTAGCPSHGDVFVAFQALRDVGFLGSAMTVGGVLLGRALRRSPRSRPALGHLSGTAPRLGLVALACGFIGLAAWPPPHHEKVDSVGVDYVAPHFDPAEVARESYPDWLRGGGIAQALTAQSALTNLFKAAEPALRQQATWAAISHDSRFRLACQTLAHVAPQTGAFPPPPGTATSAHWAAYVQLIAGFAERCTAATESADPGTETADLTAAMRTSLQPADDMTADIVAAGKSMR
ncbi:M48 family metalloprotease [Streptomyces silvisoli]|uniref:M48 family metalloprotease n=1 Tax=Streptomyces silvisoli TaxID=3034235 RepID=A0ABT5ZJ26_9ACTN|nr:M48 family metalloprotease [Streptomyces silvisoli]MDF3289842.1 M48 family metalloprotease [Streptomyces silvisoli]